MRKNYNLMKSPFYLSKKEMQSYGYKIVDTIVDHYTDEESKKPVMKASREEMDSIFLSEAPDNAPVILSCRFKNFFSMVGFIFWNVEPVDDNAAVTF